MAPLVSVLLPYRDAADTLEEAVDSVLAQRGPLRLEVLLIDDGSSDGGPALVARLAARHPALVPLATPRLGIAGALAEGLRHARGALIARMDADDVSHEERFAEQLELLVGGEPRLAALGTQVEPFPATAVAEGLLAYVAWQNGLVTPEDHARELFVEAPLCHPSVMLRREALVEVGGWRAVPFPEDYDLWLRLDAAGYLLAKVPRVLLRWRHQPGRATFTDPRYGRERFAWAKAPHLARRLRLQLGCRGAPGEPGRPLAVWGAGPTGKRLARALEAEGVFAERFVDIDPRKIGRRARGAPIVAPESLTPAHAVVVAVGARGARDLIRPYLEAQGQREGRDFLCAA